MKCPFRKIKEYTRFEEGIENPITKEFCHKEGIIFGECYANQCPAYIRGDCKLVQANKDYVTESITLNN